MKIGEIIENYNKIRQRLKCPPNAVPDPGIDLTRKSTAYKGDVPPPDTPPKKKLFEAGTQDVVFPITFNDILYAVSKFYQIPVKNLKGIHRFKPEVIARRVIVYLAIKLLGRSLTSIGRDLNKDHTTILHARRRIYQNLQTDSKLQSEVLSIEESILAKHRLRLAPAAIDQPALAVLQGQSSALGGIPAMDCNSRGSLALPEAQQCD